MVEWLEYLTSVQKVAGSNPTGAETGKHSMFTQQGMVIRLSLRRIKAVKGDDWTPCFL